MIESLQGLTFQKIQVGSHMSMALTSDGLIYVWGMGPMLGLGTIDTTVPLPRVIDELANVRVLDISAGDNHCLALSQGWD
jgi:regulator of chromosome condensation